MIGNYIGIGIGGRKGVSFPLEKSDVLVWVDGDGSDGTLTNKISGIGDVTVGTNLISNGDCEGDWGFTHFTNLPNIFERSSEQKHSGTYSWKIDCTSIQVQGIKTLPFATKIGDVVTYSFWIRRYSGAANIRWAVYNGDGITAGLSGNYTEAASPDNTWVQVTNSFIATKNGSLAYITVFVTTAIASFYVDDFSVTIPNTNVITLPVNSLISDTLINATKYYTSGNPINVRVDSILTNENDQIFFNDSYKILIYSKAVNGKTLASNLDWLEYTAPSLYNYFTTERTAKASETNKHYGFASMVFIQNRLYLFYRDGLYHNSFGGVLKFIYSDDYGVTWSLATELYTGQEIIDNNPQILIDDPRAIPDVRDLRTIIDGSNLLVFGFVAIGHNLEADDTEPSDPTNINTRVTWGYKAFSLRIPTIENTLDTDNKNISYIADQPFSGGHIIKDGIIYATTYINNVVSLYTSIDGLSWTKKSDVFKEPNLPANESSLIFVEDILYCVGRGITTTGVICRSYDHGTTWENYTEISIRIDGLFVNKLTNGKIIVFGRNSGNEKIDLYELSGLEKTGDAITLKATVTDDIGYGNFVEKNGIYYFLYGDGPDAADPIAPTFAYTGQYFKEIATRKMNTIND